MEDQPDPIPDHEIEAMFARSAFQAWHDDWQPACLRCLHVNNKLAQCCAECGAPMSQITGYGPWERVFTYGFAYQNMASGESRTTILIGVWLMFGDALLVPFMLIAAVVMRISAVVYTAALPYVPSSDPLETQADTMRQSASVESLAVLLFTTLLALALYAIHAVMLYKATRNWWVKRGTNLEP